MNNSPIRPQLPRSSPRPVDERGRLSTGSNHANIPLTRCFATSSTIHTPYYYYRTSLNNQNRRREGTTCAYPS